MNNPIQRPIFYDGQILAAGDLGESVDYSRDQLARHERYLHSWGIATGFDLLTTPQTNISGSTFMQVTVAAGVAYDGRGRELVLTSPQILDPIQFTSAHVYDSTNPDPWYPVYVQGFIDPTVPQTSLTGACAGANLATRQGEDVQFNFLPPSPSNNSSTPYPVPGPGDPTDPPNNALPWNILIGFVKWDPGTSQFSDARAYNDSGVTRRLAGVQTARVEARDGSLTLQTSINPKTKLMLVVQEAVGSNPGSMTFGADDGQGSVTKILQINAQGDLTIAGKFASATPLVPGSVLVQSGIATDGMPLPLPPGLTDDQVSKGAVLLHMQVVPIVPDTPLPGFAASGNVLLAVVPLACYVDGSRRVRCRLRYLFTSGSATTAADVAGTCHYTVVAAPAAGGTST